MPFGPTDTETIRRGWPVLLLGSLLVLSVWVREAAAKPLFAPSRNHLANEEPEEPDFVSFADRIGYSFVPNLIDIPSTQLVERHHPTLEIGYRRRHFDEAAFSNVQSANQRGVEVAYHIRAGRDFQLSIFTPFLKERLSLLAGPQPDIPGTVSALAFDIRYLVPYEIAGLRTAVGARTATLKERSHPLFVPDDFQWISSLYVVTSATPTPAVRVHALAMYVNVPQPGDLLSTNYWCSGFGYEQQLFKLKSNFVRWIAELKYHRLADRWYNYYGNLSKVNEVFYNTGLRIRSGIVQVDLGARHLGLSGFGEVYAKIVKRF